MPKRIQLSRKKGWRKPEGCIVVSRPSKWGNPFTLNGCNGDRALALKLFRENTSVARVRYRNYIRQELAGHDLACWCPLNQPCHADVLLEIANSPIEPEASHE